jgi:hypothetical protein
MYFQLLFEVLALLTRTITENCLKNIHCTEECISVRSVTACYLSAIVLREEKLYKHNSAPHRKMKELYIYYYVLCISNSKLFWLTVI